MSKEPNNQTMEASPPEAHADTSAKNDDTRSEFLVHTKHTCDVCLAEPIIGKRFTSANTDYDLCENCFDGGGLELEETLLGEYVHQNITILVLRVMCSIVQL
jgi:hypothetical protein